MSAYKMPITMAIIFFPIIAFFLTLPFLIYQYRKYGSIPFLRSAIFYSFILYLLCAYFLVILPLPAIEEVKNLTTPTMQLVPFEFITDLLNTSFNWKELTSYINVIQSPVFYIAAFNILLTIPFGIYLRYYFECKWYKAFMYGFLLSLFFELTQLSGLYGIYPRPYRLFDIDDLMLNTLGTMIGFLITPIIAIILPTRKELDEKSFEKGKKVTFLRRALAYCIDLFFFVLVFIIVSILTHNTQFQKSTIIITVFLYYIVIPLINQGKTFGKMILKLQVVAKNNKKFQKIRIMIRYILSYILFYYQAIIINLLSQSSMNNNILKYSILILKIYFVINLISIILSIVKKDKRFLYEKITQTEIISTIEQQSENEDLKTEPLEEISIKEMNKEN